MTNPVPTAAAIKWAAQLSHVREVTLRGTADLAYWTERLAAQSLTPIGHDGRAQLLLIAADARFRGVRFRELSVSVPVAPPDATGQFSDAAFLASAFNSNRFFAWCERTFFSTPYSHADVRASATPPASIELLKDGQVLFHAAMQPAPDAPRQPTSLAPAGWSGPVYLPGRSRYFIARVHGSTETHPFRPTDALTLTPSPETAVVQSLIDSHFAPTTWELRPDADHAKSKTYRASPRPAAAPPLR